MQYNFLECDFKQHHTIVDKSYSINGLLRTFKMFYGRHIGRKEMFYLATHSTHFIYGYMVSNIW